MGGSRCDQVGAAESRAAAAWLGFHEAPLFDLRERGRENRYSDKMK